MVAEEFWGGAVAEEFSGGNLEAMVVENETEVAGILIRWGAKRRRSTIRRGESGVSGHAESMATRKKNEKACEVQHRAPERSTPPKRSTIGRGESGVSGDFESVKERACEVQHSDPERRRNSKVSHS